MNATVVLGNAASDDRETEPIAAARAAGGRLPMRIEDEWEIGRRDARAVVADGEFGEAQARRDAGAMLCATLDENLTAVGRELESVLGEIEKNAVEQRTIAMHRRNVAAFGGGNRDVALLRCMSGEPRAASMSSSIASGASTGAISATTERESSSISVTRRCIF